MDGLSVMRRLEPFVVRINVPLPVELGECFPEAVGLLKVIKDSKSRNEQNRSDNSGRCGSRQMELHAPPKRNLGSRLQDLSCRGGHPDGTAEHAQRPAARAGGQIVRHGPPRCDQE